MKKDKPIADWTELQAELRKLPMQTPEELLSMDLKNLGAGAALKLQAGKPPRSYVEVVAIDQRKHAITGSA